MRTTFVSLVALASAIGCSPADEAPRADWRRTDLDDRTILLQADFSQWEASRFRAPGLFAKPGDWRWNKAFVRAVSETMRHRPETEARLRAGEGLPSVPEAHEVVGFWKSATGLTRIRDAEGKPCVGYGADVVYGVFLRTSHPLPENPDRRSPLIKVNQVGYLPWAPRKFAYLGGWLGTGGSWSPPEEVASFDVCEAASGRVVLTGALERCAADMTTPEGIPWTGERTLQADLSALREEGTYYVRVPFVGRSADFRVSASAARDVFGVQMHGLFVQRCGTDAKREPFTHWGDARCHATVRRGVHPPDEEDYHAKGRSRDFGFADETGAGVDLSPFDIIRLNAPEKAEVVLACGGWHDAADYDRRPMHLKIVNDLAGVAFLAEGAFRDGELSLPEGTNGIPDILDEAAWGLAHLQAVQRADGAVGTWFETTGHPQEGSGLPSQDTFDYYVSRPTRESTLEYAASASLLARLHPKLRERFLESSLRAWKYVLSAPREVRVPFRAPNGRTVYWTEKPDLSPSALLKAALNLSELTGDGRYLEETLSRDRFLQRFQRELGDRGIFWGPFRPVELLSDTRPMLKPYRDACFRRICQRADSSVAAVSSDRAYRPLWNPPGDHPTYNGMAWGNCHPLRLAAWPLVAWHFTRRRAYLDAVTQAFDFHCGCNPDGLTLTTGLGGASPVSILHLQSSADSIAEVARGLTPYRWTGGLGAEDGKLVHDESDQRIWPVWRRRPNLEVLHVPSGEFSVWETMHAAAAVSGYLSVCPASEEARGTSGASRAGARFLDPPPVADRRLLSGYWALP